MEPDGGNTGKGKPTDNEGRRSRKAKASETTLRGSTKANSQMHEMTPEGQTSREMRKTREEEGGFGDYKAKTQEKQRARGKGRRKEMKGGKR